MKETEGAIFKGEEVDTFELGVKAPLADNKVQVTAALFYNAYRNVQVAAHARPQFPSISIAVVNAGSARTYGAEAGITARVAEPLTLGASVGYLNARYNELVIPPTNPVLYSAGPQRHADDQFARMAILVQCQSRPADQRQAENCRKCRCGLYR